MNYFNIDKIKYEGATSTNPLAFKYYNPEEIVMGKTMKEHLRFSVAYWHTFDSFGSDQFGEDTMVRAWDNIEDAVEKAKIRVKVAFEFFEKLGVEFFAFHDRDIAPEMDTLEKTNKVLDEVVDVIETEMKRTGIKLLWGTTNAFSNKRFMAGAASAPNADVFAFYAAQVKKAIDITHRLNGAGYTFWGGREGYDFLLNTDMKLEQDNIARFFKMACDYADEIGYTGQFYIEPKPMEPTKHQYDFDSATVHGFLLKYGLEDRFKVNIETNHATLAGHTMHHEIRYAVDNGILGSVDANEGDMLLGWDTDEFPVDIYTAVYVMYEILRDGGLKTGGLNFDSKLRRQSIDVEDMFLGHILGMDTYAKALKIAAKMLEDNVLEDIIINRYDSYNHGIGKDIIDNKVGLVDLEKYALKLGEVSTNKSGRQEHILSVINKYVFETK